MTQRVEAHMDAEAADKFPDNTSGDISALDVRRVFGDMVDSCFRENALFLESGDGRLLLESGDGYLELSEPIDARPAVFYLYYWRADDFDIIELDTVNETATNVASGQNLTGNSFTSMRYDSRVFGDYFLAHVHSRTFAVIERTGSTLQAVGVAAISSNGFPGIDPKFPPGMIVDDQYMFLVDVASGGGVSRYDVSAAIASSPFSWSSGTDYFPATIRDDEWECWLDFVGPDDTGYEDVCSELVLWGDSNSDVNTHAVPCRIESGAVVFYEAGLHDLTSADDVYRGLAWSRSEGIIVGFDTTDAPIWDYDVATRTVTLRGTGYTFEGAPQSPQPGPTDVEMMCYCRGFWVTVPSTNSSYFDVWSLSGTTFTHVTRWESAVDGDGVVGAGLNGVQMVPVNDHFFMAHSSGSGGSQAALIGLAADGSVEKVIEVPDSQFVGSFFGNVRQPIYSATLITDQS